MSKDSRRSCKPSHIIFSVACLLASCAATKATAPPELQPPDARRTVTALHASGVQIYLCKRADDGRLLWAFKAPEATLQDDARKVVVKHYAGPTWEAPDGSKITGAVLKQAPNPQAPNSIPLLLLRATSTGGAGLFATTRYVQRLNTQGGVAPPQPCAQEGQEMRVPYTADYVFLE